MSHLLKDLPFDPKVVVDDSTYNRAKQWLLTNVATFTSTANFCVFDYKNGQRPYIGAACHYNVQFPEVSGPRACVATEIAIPRAVKGITPYGVKTKRNDDSLYLPFLKWFTQESDFSRFILSRDDFEMSRTAGIIVSADIPAQILQAVMVISRHFYECSTLSFETFNRLYVEKGVPGILAYTLAFNSTLSRHWNDTSLDQHPVTSSPGHRLQKLPESMNDLLLLLRGDVGANGWRVLKKDTKNPDLLQTYATNARFTGVAQLFTSLPPENEFATEAGFIIELIRTDATFREKLSVFRKEKVEGEMYRPPNPFLRPSLRASKPNREQISYKEMEEVLIPHLHCMGVFTL